MSLISGLLKYAIFQFWSLYCRQNNDDKEKNSKNEAAASRFLIVKATVPSFYALLNRRFLCYLPAAYKPLDLSQKLRTLITMDDKFYSVCLTDRNDSQ